VAIVERGETPQDHRREKRAVAHRQLGPVSDFKEATHKSKLGLGFLKKYQNFARGKGPGAGRKKNVPNRTNANRERQAARMLNCHLT